MKTIKYVLINIILAIFFAYYFTLFAFSHIFLIFPTYLIFVVLLINFGLIVFKKYQVTSNIFIVLIHILCGYAIFIGCVSDDILYMLRTITAFFFLVPIIAVLFYWIKTIGGSKKRQS